MSIKPTPDHTLEPPDPEPVDRVAWEVAFIAQWRIFQRDAADLNITLELAEDAAEFSWANDGGELEGADAARDEICAQFDCICMRKTTHMPSITFVVCPKCRKRVVLVQADPWAIPYGHCQKCEKDIWMVFDSLTREAWVEMEGS